MKIREHLKQLLGPLVGDRIYQSVTPDVSIAPLMVYQVISGSRQWYIDNSIAEIRQARVQLHVWAKRQREADAIIEAAALRLSRSGLVVEPYGEPTDLYEEALKLYGARQDFGIQFADPLQALIDEP